MKFIGKDFMNLPIAIPGEIDSLDRIAERANSLLAEMLKDAPVVFCEMELEGPCFVKQGQFSQHTHRARLVCIEEIK